MLLAEVLGGVPKGGRCLVLGARVPGIASQVGVIVDAEEVVVVDTSYEVLEREKSSANNIRITPVFTRVIERVVDLPSNSFDLVVAVDSLESALNKKGFMTEVRRLLKKGGRFVLITRVKRLLSKHGVSREEFEKLLLTAGFKVELKRNWWRKALAVMIKTVD